MKKVAIRRIIGNPHSGIANKSTSVDLKFKL